MRDGKDRPIRMFINNLEVLWMSVQGRVPIRIR